MSSGWHLYWLGTGSAQTETLVNASAVLEHENRPLLMIDCGDSALMAYRERYGAPPEALFITHAHMDHVGGLERLFYQLIFDESRRGRCRLYVPANLVPVLQARVADYPSPLAEGGANFWDAFQLIAVGRGFWHAGWWFDVFPVQHHIPMTAFGIALANSFLWTGDTRPIPGEVARFGGGEALIAHDCAVVGNPSHTGIDDLLRTYDAGTRQRMCVYHYRIAAEKQQFEAHGLNCAADGDRSALAEPMPAWQAAGLAWQTAA